MARPPKPTAIRLLRGTYNPEKRQKEPKRPFAVPDPPKDLKADEREAWLMFSQEVEALRVTCKEDRAMFRLLVSSYCDAEYLRWQVNKLREAGELTYETTTASGGTMHRPRPEMALLDNADRKLMTLLGRFGLSPSDRARVHDQTAGDKNSGDPDSEFT